MQMRATRCKKPMDITLDGVSLNADSTQTAEEGSLDAGSVVG